ncbi:MAG: Maf family protein [Planctomycetota bacterium]|nr:Maf family protein [Planctomycetota bacterium]
MPNLLLASSSPRRRLLLEEAGFDFVAWSPGIDDGELVPGEVTPEQWVAALAFLKASAGVGLLPAIEPAFAADPTGHWLVLGADTLVDQEGELLGQPRDIEQARTTIQTLAGNTHQVHTGVALLDPRTRRRHIFVDSATVAVGEISDADREAYLETGHWQGKAGAYNLHERLDAGWPITYEGDPTTIVGLPMSRLLALFEHMDITPNPPSPAGHQ